VRVKHGDIHSKANLEATICPSSTCGLAAHVHFAKICFFSLLPQKHLCGSYEPLDLACTNSFTKKQLLCTCEFDGRQLNRTSALTTNSILRQSCNAMPANNREQKLRAEAQFFCKTKSLYPIQCKHFKPTLKEVQSTTFSDYVRNTVLRKCEEDYEDDDEDEPEIVEERHDTRNRSTVEISKSLKAINRKINYDYGKWYVKVFLLHFKPHLDPKPSLRY